MKSPFKILFKGEISETPNKTVLENFKENFNKTYCDHIIINGDKELVVKNDFFRWKPDTNMNLWVGIRNATVTIIKSEEKTNRTVYYSIDYTRLAFSSISTIITLPIIFKLSGIWDNQSLKYLIIFLVPFSIIVHLIAFLRHWSIFKRTLKHGTEYLGNYNWTEILENKNDKELIEIINGNRQLPKSVSKMAELELRKRRPDAEC